MKKQLIISGIVASAFLSSTAHAGYSFPNFLASLKPYGGVDFGMQHFGFKEGYGDNLFKKQLPKGNVFAGVKFNEYFGVEGGYESTIEKKKDAIIVSGTYLGRIAGIGLLPGETAQTFTRTKIAGWHAGISGDYPIHFNKSYNPLHLLGYVGIKNTRVTLTSNIYKFAGAQASSQHTLSSDSKKALIRLSTGLQYFMHKNIGVRGLVAWENTAKLKPYTSSSTYQAKLKNSVSYSLGIVLNG